MHRTNYLAPLLNSATIDILCDKTSELEWHAAAQKWQCFVANSIRNIKKGVTYDWNDLAVYKANKETGTFYVSTGRGDGKDTEYLTCNYNTQGTLLDLTYKSNMLPICDTTKTWQTNWQKNRRNFFYKLSVSFRSNDAYTVSEYTSHIPQLRGNEHYEDNKQLSGFNTDHQNSTFVERALSVVFFGGVINPSIKRPVLKHDTPFCLYDLSLVNTKA